MRKQRTRTSTTKSAIEGSAASAKSPLPSGKSQSEDSASSPYLTGQHISLSIFASVFNRSSNPLQIQGLQLHHQRGWSANVCWDPHFYYLLQQNHELLGLVRTNVNQKYEKSNKNIQSTTISCFHMISTQVHFDRYTREDPSVVAISLSPEGSLLLGSSGFFVPK